MRDFKELWKIYEPPGMLFYANYAANVAQEVKVNQGDTSADSYTNECLKKIKETTLKAATQGKYHTYVRCKAYDCPEDVTPQEKTFLEMRVYRKMREYLESLKYEVDYFYAQKDSIVTWDISW